MALKRPRTASEQALFIMIDVCTYCGYSDRNAMSSPIREPRFYLDRHIIFLRFLKSRPFCLPLPSPVPPESTSIKPNFGRKGKMRSRNECLIIESIVDLIMVYCLILGVGWAHCKERGTKFISLVIIFQTRHQTEGTHFSHRTAPSTRRVALCWRRCRSYHPTTHISFVVRLGGGRGASSWKLGRYLRTARTGFRKGMWETSLTSSIWIKWTERAVWPEVVFVGKSLKTSWIGAPG